MPENVRNNDWSHLKFRGCSQHLRCLKLVKTPINDNSDRVATVLTVLPYILPAAIPCLWRTQRSGGNSVCRGRFPLAGAAPRWPGVVQKSPVCSTLGGSNRFIFPVGVQRVQLLCGAREAAFLRASLRGGSTLLTSTLTTLEGSRRKTALHPTPSTKVLLK